MFWVSYAAIVPRRIRVPRRTSVSLHEKRIYILTLLVLSLSMFLFHGGRGIVTLLPRIRRSHTFLQILLNGRIAYSVMQ
ncbi:hypothetical protein N008_19935 [Hymenobacter sp. APR13]|nr:hypothetical protein N008_19935 [Hymenobacter sp. APR13]